MRQHVKRILFLKPMKTKNPIEIIPFSIELSSYVKALNYEWLEKYFKVEKGDVISLSNPQKEIIDKATDVVNKYGFVYLQSERPYCEQN